MGSLAFLRYFFVIVAYFDGTVSRAEQEYDNYQEFAVVEGRKLMATHCYRIYFNRNTNEI